MRQRILHTQGVSRISARVARRSVLGCSGVILETREQHGEFAGAAVLSSEGRVHGSAGVSRHAGVHLPGLHRIILEAACVLAHTQVTQRWLRGCDACFK